MRGEPSNRLVRRSAAGTPFTRRRSGPLGIDARLAVDILALAGGSGELVAHRQRPWASITFSGSRHELTLAFSGIEAIAAGEALIAVLPDHEFAIPGHLVADAAVREVDQVTLPEPRLIVELELLLLEEA